MSTIATGRSTADLIKIAAAGGSFWMSPVGRTTADLVQIVSTAKANGCTVTILGTVGRSTADLIQIAAAGRGGHVVFAPSREHFNRDG